MNNNYFNDIFQSTVNFTLQQSLYPINIMKYDGNMDLDKFKHSYAHLFSGWSLVVLRIVTFIHLLGNLILVTFLLMGLNWRFKKGGD